MLPYTSHSVSQQLAQPKPSRCTFAAVNLQRRGYVSPAPPPTPARVTTDVVIIILSGLRRSNPIFGDLSVGGTSAATRGLRSVVNSCVRIHSWGRLPTVGAIGTLGTQSISVPLTRRLACSPNFEVTAAHGYTCAKHTPDNTLESVLKEPNLLISIWLNSR